MSRRGVLFIGVIVGFLAFCIVGGVIAGRSRSTGDTTPSSRVTSPRTMKPVQPVYTGTPSVNRSQQSAPSTSATDDAQAIIHRQVLRFEGVYFTLAAQDTSARKMAALNPATNPIISRECNCYVAVPSGNRSTITVLPLQTNDLAVTKLSSIRAQVKLIVRQQTTTGQVTTLNPVQTCMIGLTHVRATWLVDSVAC